MICRECYEDDPPDLTVFGTPQWGAGVLGDGPADQDDPPSLTAFGTPQWGASVLGSGPSDAVATMIALEEIA